MLLNYDIGLSRMSSNYERHNSDAATDARLYMWYDWQHTKCTLSEAEKIASLRRHRGLVDCGRSTKREETSWENTSGGGGEARAHAVMTITASEWRQNNNHAYTKLATAAADPTAMV